MRLRIVALAAAAAAMPAFGQNAPKQDTAAPPTSNRVVLSKGQTIQSAVANMAKAAGALAAVDPALNGRVSEATSKLPLEKGLDLIAKENRAQWRKVYLADAEIPRLADGTIDARRLSRMVMSVATVQTANIGVVDPTTGQMTVTSRAPESSPGMLEWAKTRKAVYVLYSPVETATVRTAGPGGDMLPPGGIEAFKNMTPEQRAQWMKDHGGVIVTSDMSPEERAQALQNLSPEERARIEEKMNQAGQSGGASVMIMRKETNQ